MKYVSITQKVQIVDGAELLAEMEFTQDTKITKGLLMGQIRHRLKITPHLHEPLLRAAEIVIQSEV